MWNDFFSSLSLIDISGYAIIAAIVFAFIVSVIVNTATLRLYGGIEKDLARHAASGEPFRHRVLNRIVREAEKSLSAPAAQDSGFQALIEHHFKRELNRAFIAERLWKSSGGLMIILGLVGTFFGLTLSIGKLVTLITGDVTGAAELTESLTTGLAGALSGMSVAFSTSLFGIVAAIAVMLIGVFFNPADRRAALMLRLEVYLDTLARQHLDAAGGERGGSGSISADSRTVEAIESFGASVLRLEASIHGFDEALDGFSRNTRDFQELNLHLKDNIQRMSLGFADFSEALKQQVIALKSDRNRS